MRRSKVKWRSEFPVIKIGGWTLIAHPLFIDQLMALRDAVKQARAEDPANYKRTGNAKLLAAITEIVLRRIPADPTNKRYRQGGTLGDDYKHWFRDKFGNGRFRMFFRYDGTSKVIAFVWVNDEDSLRTRGSKSDAYAVFKKMLDSGNPPDSWETLKAQCKGLDEIEGLAEDVAQALNDPE